MDCNAKVVETLKKIIDRYGIDVLNDYQKCSSMFGDFEPKLTRERRVLNNVLSTGITSALLHDKNMTEVEILAILNRSRQETVDKFFIDSYYTEIMINSIAAALNLKVFLTVHLDEKKAINRLEENISIKPYKFKGKSYKDIVSLLTALGKSWNEGKRELYDGKISNFFKSEKNAELTQRIRRGFESIKQTQNTTSTIADAVFCKFLYDGIGPSQFIWCGQVYRNLDELAKSIFAWIRSEEFKKNDKGVDLFGVLLEMGIISCYLQSHSGIPLEDIKKIEHLEKEYLYAQSDDKRIELQAMCGLELMHRRYFYQGQFVSTPEEIVQFILLNASGDIEKLDKIAEGIMCNYRVNYGKVDVVFSSWLKLLGFEKQLNKLKT